MTDQDQQRAREIVKQLNSHAREESDVEVIAAALAAVREEGREWQKLMADSTDAALDTNEAIQRAEEAVQCVGSGTHAQRIDHLVAELRETIDRLTAQILALQAEREPPPALPLSEAIHKTRP